MSRGAEGSTPSPYTSAERSFSGVDTFSPRTRQSVPLRIVSRLVIGIAMSDITSERGSAPSNSSFSRVLEVTLTSGPPSVGMVANGSSRTCPGRGAEVDPAAASGGSYTQAERHHSPFRRLHADARQGCEPVQPGHIESDSAELGPVAREVRTDQTPVRGDHFAAELRPSRHRNPEGSLRDGVEAPQ